VLRGVVVEVGVSIPSAEERDLYELGRQARTAGLERNRCPYGMTNALRRSWWLAGWHDADMEQAQSLV
jgi:ribosome modulation factor